MKANTLANLEKDDKFRKENLPKLFWFKQAAIYPPAATIFLALYGLIYLLNNEKIISYYAIPFVVLLIGGTIWLKATKKLITKILLESNEFKVCFAHVAYIENGFFHVVYTTSENRHDKQYIENFTRKVREKHPEISGRSFKKAALIDFVEVGDEPIYIRSFYSKDILMHYPNSNINSLIAVAVIKDNTFFVKNKYIK